LGKIRKSVYRKVKKGSSIRNYKKLKKNYIKTTKSFFKKNAQRGHQYGTTKIGEMKKGSSIRNTKKIKLL